MKMSGLLYILATLPLGKGFLVSAEEQAWWDSEFLGALEKRKIPGIEP
jgi:hypothetical protein